MDSGITCDKVSDIELKALIDKHKKTCHKKRMCDICKVNYKDYTGRISQCDYCGYVYDNTTQGDFIECKCGSNWIYLCSDCIGAQDETYDIIECDHGTLRYYDSCCKPTKGIKSKK